jgi:hypothetical protein
MSMGKLLGSPEMEKPGEVQGPGCGAETNCATSGAARLRCSGAGGPSHGKAFFVYTTIFVASEVE